MGLHISNGEGSMTCVAGTSACHQTSRQWCSQTAHNPHPLRHQACSQCTWLRGASDNVITLLASPALGVGSTEWAWFHTRPAGYCPHSLHPYQVSVVLSHN
ncbi:hypothetical protein PR048_013833 [Dryococelus australis]|uniref:Uncharacterized protein n=1 Tax=Dryococelus australis TaxID=614101 RepID=A0ABQ9HU55_9NEOP|nr:hypothetical protein PR048_013833 [Dryococelus australis]